MRRALARGARRGHRAVLLVGDAAYYGRFGFSAEKTGALWLPGAVRAHRLLGAASSRRRARRRARPDRAPASAKPRPQLLAARLAGNGRAAQPLKPVTRLVDAARIPRGALFRSPFRRLSPARLSGGA